MEYGHCARCGEKKKCLGGRQRVRVAGGPSARGARALHARGVLAPEEAVRPHVLARLHVDADAEPRPRAQGDGRRERNAAESQKGLQGWTSTVCYSELTRSSMTKWWVPYPILPPPSVVLFCPGLRRSLVTTGCSSSPSGSRSASPAACSARPSTAPVVDSIYGCFRAFYGASVVF